MRFLLGFVTASLIWALAAALLYRTDVITILDEPSPEPAAAVSPSGDEPPRGSKRRAGRRERTARAPRGSSSVTRGDDGPEAALGEATTGDDLDWRGEQRVDMVAGEAQLSGTQIEAGFDGAMGKIKRCLVLVPGSGEVTGKLTFGMRVGADGRPRAVNLTGPAAVTAGESGDCLRAAAQAIRFAEFDGPDMLFRYPITLH